MLVRFLLWWVFASAVAGVHATEILVISSERTAGYVEALDALVAELAKSGQPVSDVDLQMTKDVAGTIAAHKPRVIVTLGLESLRQVVALDLRTPVLAALIPRSGYERIVHGNAGRMSVAALYLDQPVARQLDLVRLAFPAAQRVGVLWGGESQGLQALLAAAAVARGLTLVGNTVGPSRSVSSALTDTLEASDVLLAVPDPQVFNPNTVSNVLMSTYRARVPVLGFSPAYARAGAALSLHTLPVQVGVRAGVLVRQFVQTGVLPPSQYPLDFAISVNERVARSLELALDANVLTEQLRRLERRP